jgi:hypothetical protein
VFLLLSTKAGKDPSRSLTFSHPINSAIGNADSKPRFWINPNRMGISLAV